MVKNQWYGRSIFPNKKSPEFLVTSQHNTGSLKKSLYKGPTINTYAIVGFFQFFWFCEIVGVVMEMTVSLEQDRIADMHQTRRAYIGAMVQVLTDNYRQLPQL